MNMNISCVYIEKPKTVYTNAKKQLIIYSPPAILTLHLKRFQQNGYSFNKVNRHVDFSMMLDLAPFCSTLSQVGRTPIFSWMNPKNDCNQSAGLSPAGLRDGESQRKEFKMKMKFRPTDFQSLPPIHPKVLPKRLSLGNSPVDSSAFLTSLTNRGFI